MVISEVSRLRGLLCGIIHTLAIFLCVGCAASHSPLPLIIPPPPPIPTFQLPEAVGLARTLYVDQNITEPFCETYSPSARSCSKGADIVYRELAEAAFIALPGDTVLIREGIYSDQLAPARSGAPGALITFKSYTGETVTLTGMDKIICCAVSPS